METHKLPEHTAPGWTEPEWLALLDDGRQEALRQKADANDPSLVDGEPYWRNVNPQTELLMQIVRMLGRPPTLSPGSTLDNGGRLRVLQALGFGPLQNP